MCLLPPLRAFTLVKIKDKSKKVEVNEHTLVLNKEKKPKRTRDVEPNVPMTHMTSYLR